jgi:hypothetical protein
MRTEKRSVLLLACACALPFVSACASEAGADPQLAPIVEVEPPVATDHVILETTTTEAGIDQVADCVRYVPFAAGTGNFYMQVIWNQANHSEARLRGICEEMADDDPAGLARISEEQQAVDRFFEAASQTTVIPDCPPGSVLGADGFCQAG